MLLKGKTFLSVKIITSLDSTKGVTLKHLIPPSPKMQYFSNLIEMLSDLARHLSSILHSIVSLSQVNVQNGTLTRKRTHSSERANECNFKLPCVGAHPKYPITQSPTSPNIIVTNDQVWEKTWWKEKFFYFPPKRVQSMHFCPAVARLMIGWWDGIGKGT